MKLPFVWELKNELLTSHLIGSPHGFSINHALYTVDLVKYLNDKGLVLVEEINGFGNLDATVELIARETKVDIKPIATSEESNIFYHRYGFNLRDQPEPVAAYRQADADKLKKIYEGVKNDLTPDQLRILEQCNPNMVALSLPELEKLPALIIVDLAHLLIEPTMLQFYQKKGINIEKIQ